jgi:hypothetical protein
MRGAVGHPASSAARTDTAPLTRIRDKQIVAACVAPKSHEPVRKNAAAQVGAKLLLDVARQRRLVGLARVPQKGLEVIAHGAIEDGFRGSAREVGGSETSHAPLAMLGRVPVAVASASGGLPVRDPVRVRIPVAQDRAVGLLSRRVGAMGIGGQGANTERDLPETMRHDLPLPSFPNVIVDLGVGGHAARPAATCHALGP